jgi:hypothetical protein
MNAADAQLELAMMNAQAQKLDRLDVTARLTNAGLPAEVIFRLQEIWENTKILAGKVVHIGRIVLLHILRFIEENPNLAIGVALGAALGALTATIPLIGPLIAPASAMVGALVGGWAGLQLDRGERARFASTAIMQDVIIVARKAFELLADVLNTLFASEAASAAEGSKQ